MHKNMRRYFNNYRYIKRYYHYLVDLTKKHVYVGTVNEWILDNYYVLIEHHNTFLKTCESKKNFIAELAANKNLYQVVYSILDKFNFKLTNKSFLKELNHYQEKNNDYFSYRELNTIPTLLMFCTTERLRQLCENEYLKLEDRLKAEELKQKIDQVRAIDEKVSLEHYIHITPSIEQHPIYLEHLNYLLQEIGHDASDIFRKLNAYLESVGCNLKDILNQSYLMSAENDILVASLWQSYTAIFELEIEEIYQQVSKVEKLLLKEAYYPLMTVSTKAMYRDRILKLSRKAKISEYEYAKNLLEKSVEEQQHIGFYLFPKKNIHIRTFCYLAFVWGMTGILAYFFSAFLLSNRLFSFLLLILPINELVLQITNHLLLKIFPPDELPKYDYSKGIPLEDATMIVIPTILKNKEKVYELFRALEAYYLANQTEHLYFSLLGDCKEHTKESYEYDEEICRAGMEECKRLNQKYGKQLFYFVYRKRIYNTSEKSWIGFERKRGALLHFSQLLLHKMSVADKKHYFQVQNIDDLTVPIKYVITLDTDTKVVLNTASKLVGTMAHPLNHPVLNASKTKVIQGYGIMQPRISLDVESTNRSVYSQLFAGIGGFDVYSSVVPNLYQDLFHEGSFVGKGIFNLKTFDTILADAFPNNLILSHDLLEGNYLRCAYVSDIELYDGFPSKYLTDSTRRHRWARGDTQLIKFLFPCYRRQNGKCVKNPLNALEKWKIFDNIRRSFLDLSYLVILMTSYLIGVSNPLIFLFLILFIIAFPVLVYIQGRLRYQRKTETKNKYYEKLLYGGRAVFLRCFIVFASIPYNACLYIDATFRSLYRMLISKEKLLNWLTAEEASQTVKNDLKTYIKQFYINYITVGLFIILAILINPTNLASIVIICLIFSIAPFVLYNISQDIKSHISQLSSVEQEELQDLAYHTWQYFATYLTEENSYLIPDNYQLNRPKKEDFKTSSTNIGLSLLSVISAYELNFIAKEKALELLNHIVESANTLEKWHGHLYNWYHIKTKEKLYPYYVSSVDSGNFIASIFVTRAFAQKHEDRHLFLLCDALINGTDFSKLYTEEEVFSIGYDSLEEHLSAYHYNKFASESRIVSFIGIITKHIPAKHWFCLDKTLTKYKGYKGLVSWSGTSFEYYMPLIFMKNYENTLLDESYKFAYFCEKDYIKTIDSKLPFGMSESAYAEYDDNSNYKYKAFSTPYLKIQNDMEEEIVLSPYSSILAISLHPKEIVENLKKFKELDMYGAYGFYESYDYDKKVPVKAYFAHHQAMTLASITNYLKDGAIQNYFHDNIEVEAFDILLKEKIQVRSLIDQNINQYKKYNYEREQIENDIRVSLSPLERPEISVLSNGKYSLLINDRGNGFSRYQSLQLNRYRKITEQDYGMYLYIKDQKYHNIWSNTYAPMNLKPDKYEAIFATDRIKFVNKLFDITTTTEIVTLAKHDAEIRKVTFLNHSAEKRVLELTSYTEPILSPNTDDIAHRTFQNLFVRTDYDEDSDALICSRKTREDKTYFMVQRLYVKNALQNTEYETSREEFIGRNRNTNHPKAMEQKHLSNQVGDSIDPVMSLRTSIEIPANGKITAYLISGFGHSKDQVLEIIQTYNNKYVIEKAFDLATITNNMNTKMLGLTGPDMRLYNIMLNYLYQTSKININDKKREIMRRNTLSQENLWRYGISGDRPMIFVDIHDINAVGLVKEVLRAFEYYKSKALHIDVIILNTAHEEEAKIVKDEVDEALYKINILHDFAKEPGNVYLLDRVDVNEDEFVLLNEVARLRLNTLEYLSLQEYIEALQKDNELIEFPKAVGTDTLPNDEPTNHLKFYNGFGGFQNNGKEYVITNPDTPLPWCNVLANQEFGSIVTNNANGFTYYSNSREYKITPWTNDTIVDDKSEGIKIDGCHFNPSSVIHGFGYSIFKGKTKELEETLTEFVSSKDHVKFYLFHMKNITKKTHDYEVGFWINPVLGVTEEKTNRHILSDYDTEYQFLRLRNVYSQKFNHVNVILGSTEKIETCHHSQVHYKSIETKITLKAGEEKTVGFLLGASTSYDALPQLLSYRNLEQFHKAFQDVKDDWENQLQRIQVHTEDDSFNYVINGWYLYQALSSRLYAKAGFYQVGGAYGYRDQLQDSVNIVNTHSDITRRQIIENARHQFHEGDVLHWWHKELSFGLRSKFKDDYLWLVYATIEYIEKTADISILDELIPYVQGESLKENEAEKGIPFTYSDDVTSLYQHVILALDKAMSSLGKHHIPLMGGGDWNDGMNKVGIEGKGESVWLGFFLHIIIERLLLLKDKYDLPLKKTKYERFNERLKENLRKHCYDGDYYIRAFFDNGDVLGSHKNDECKIDLLSQSFAILSEVATLEQVKKIITEVDDKLVDQKNHLIRLLTPAFEHSKNNPGYIMEYPNGIRENGGQYTHACAWYIMALIKAMEYDKAYQYYQMINPIQRTLSPMDAETYSLEPYVIAADIYTNPRYPGRGGWSWYTGSAAWFYRVGIESILGFQKHGNRLTIHPHVPSNWTHYSIDYRYIDTMYHINVELKDKTEYKIDGKKVKNNEILLENDTKEHIVNIMIKKDVKR